MTGSYRQGSTEQPLRDLTMGSVLSWAADVYPYCEAVVSCHQGTRYTYSQLREVATRAARGLRALGVAESDRVALIAPSCAEWIVAQYGIALAGAIAVVINPAYGIGEMRHALRQSGASVAIVGRRFLNLDLISTLATVVPDLATSSDGRVKSAELPDLRLFVVIGRDGDGGGLPWDALLAAGGAAGESVPMPAATREDIGAILYTSGTTGVPKGVTLSHTTLTNGGHFIGDQMAYTDADRVCLPVPLCHCFGCVVGVLAAFTHGSTVVLPDAAFDSKSCLRAVERERCTALYGVPTMFLAMLEYARRSTYRLETLRTGIIAGATCPPNLIREIAERMHMPQIVVSYGMTECPPLAQSNVADSLDVRATSVGAVLPHNEWRIVDQSGAVVPYETPGELCVRGYGVMRGYWNDAAGTAAAVDPAGWLHSGDLARMRADGRVEIIGRLKDIIIKGGENVDPREIEDVLRAHAKILDAYIVGVPDSRYGEEIYAWVRLRSGEAVSMTELRAFCGERIGAFKVPRHIQFIDAFPTTASGKVRKTVLRERAISNMSKLEIGRAHV